MTTIQAWLDAQGLGRYAAEFLAQDVSVDLLPELTEADLRELGMASMGDRKRLLRAVASAAAGAGMAGQAAPPPPSPQGDAGLRSAAAAAAQHPLAPGVAWPASAEARAASPGLRAAEGGAGAAIHPGSAPTPVSAAPAASASLPGEGERRHATVMFSDLTGYTALNEAFDPEEVEGIMARIKEAANRVIERHGGRVNQFVGDEVMAMFGIPVARRDDPRRAVSAALELHRAVDDIARGLSARLGRVLSMHTGVQSGLVIARRSDARSGDHTLTGDTVNTAARLRGLAAPGEVVVSQQTWQQVSDWFDAEAGAPVEVKGKERPLVPYRILAERAVPKAGGNPLVGRGEEMQQFGAMLDACVQRQRGRVVFVRGDPGMGKSRLVAEFLHEARERGLACHAAAILDFGARTGHDAVRSLAQSLMGLAGDADEPSRAEAIAEIAARAPAAAHAPFLYDLLDVEPPLEVRSLLAAMDGPSLQKATLDALAHLAAPGPDAAPCLLVVEDIHWADPETLRQVAALATLAARQPLLVLMSTRFAGDPSVGEWRSALHGLPMAGIDLGPLAQEDALRLAAGAASMSEALLRSCVERAEGNPLFLEQLLLNAGDESAASLPGSIQALIQARMDRLPAADKNALQAAAVWGQRVPLAMIRHLVGDPHYDPRLLVEQFLLRADGDAFVFCHALIRDGAYGSLLHTRRRHLHQLAAEWAEPLDMALAAEHFERAEDPRVMRAGTVVVKALVAAYQYAKALDWVDRGLRLARAGDDLFTLRLARARLLLEVGRVPEAIAASTVAVEAAGSGSERAQALMAKAACLRIVDRPQEGLALLDEAQPLAEAAGLTLELSRLHGLRGNLLFGSGHPAECQAAHERALELAREAGSVEAEAAALGGVGDACYARGRVLTAHAAIEQCLALARQHGLLRVEVAYLAMKGWCLLYMMQVPAAVQLCEEAIALAVRMAQPRSEMMGRAQMALLDGWVRGHWEACHPHLDRALEIARALGSSRFEAMGWMMRALLAVRAGDPAGARECLDTSERNAGPGGMGFFGPQLYGLRARIAGDDATRDQALATGESLLHDAVSHSHFLFCESAIQVSLERGAWSEAERYAVLLEDFTAAEPFPWVHFILARARALCRVGRGERHAELRTELLRLREHARAAQSTLYIPDFEAALAYWEPAAA